MSNDSDLLHPKEHVLRVEVMLDKEVGEDQYHGCAVVAVHQGVHVTAGSAARAARANNEQMH